MKELDLDIKNYDLPQFVLNALSLTVLKLSLSNMKFTCQGLERLIYGLPPLESLCLYFRNDLKNFSISSHVALMPH